MNFCICKNCEFGQITFDIIDKNGRLYFLKSEKSIPIDDRMKIWKDLVNYKKR